MSDQRAERELPLFPLHTVLFPGGLLGLKVFEARYLDLIATCLREREPFGVVALRSGGELRAGVEAVSFEAVGTLAELIDVDSDQSGILQVRCRGTQRFRIHASRQQADGLWLARSSAIAGDDPVAPTDALRDAARALTTLIDSLAARGDQPFLEPYGLDDAGWIADRWCEVLPIALAAKQKLLELRDPLLRLQLVADFLRGQGVVS